MVSRCLSPPHRVPFQPTITVLRQLAPLPHPYKTSVVPQVYPPEANHPDHRHADHVHLFAAAPAAVLFAYETNGEARTHSDGRIWQCQLDKLQIRLAGCAD